MDEVDNIILYHLRAVGCEIDNDIHGLKQFNSSTFVEATARCLRAIDSSVDVHHRLPPSMAAQFRVGANIAAAVQNIGYRGDIGYHTFMYVNESEMRKILLYLVDRLPKEHLELKSTSSDAWTVLQKLIAEKVLNRSRVVWTPIFRRLWHENAMKLKSCRLLIPSDISKALLAESKELPSYVSVYLPLIFKQPRHSEEVQMSVMETNVFGCVQYHDGETGWSSLEVSSTKMQKDTRSRKIHRLTQKLTAKLGAASQSLNQVTLGDFEEIARNHHESGFHRTKRSRFVQMQHQQFTGTKPIIQPDFHRNGDVEMNHGEDNKHVEKDDCASLQMVLLNLVSDTERHTNETRKLQLGIQQRLDQCKEFKGVIDNKEKLTALKEQTVSLLPDASINVTKLEDMVDASCKRLIVLSKQWERHRVTLLNQCKQLMDDAVQATIHKDRHLDDLLWQQAKLKDLATEMRDKDEVFKQLSSEYEKMVKEVNRSAYTHRILEIVANIRKQNQEIDKVLQDTKAVQKEINYLCGKLDRIFTVTDEIIFKDAKKDDSVRKAYKYLASMHENWGALIKTVEETGVILKQIRDLDEQLEADDRNKVTENLQQICSDYQQMLAENKTLVSKLT